MSTNSQLTLNKGIIGFFFLAVSLKSIFSLFYLNIFSNFSSLTCTTFIIRKRNLLLGVDVFMSQ